MKRRGCFEELRTAYDVAFGRFRYEVQMFKFAESDANPDLLNTLKRRVDEAQLVYRQTRDDLAQFIMDQQLEAVEEVEKVA